MCLAGLVVLLAPGPARADSSLVLGIQGDHFTVNGTAKFLVFVSYFDALDVRGADIEADLTYLKQRGIDGIRIFADWRTQTSRASDWSCAGDTVIDPGGNIQEGPFNNMIYLLNKAREHGMFVDITLSSEIVSTNEAGHCASTLTHGELAAGVQQLTTLLKGDGYRHVMFDLQNEVDKSSNSLQDGPISMANVASLIDGSVHAIDPDRIVFASLTETSGDAKSGAGADSVRARFAEQHAMVIAYHDPRRNGWEADTTDVVNHLKGTLPVYLQEPERSDNGHSWDGTAAVKLAKAAGAAAWTFHTSAGFFMNDRGIASHFTDTSVPPELYESERTFLANLPSALASTGWGLPPTNQTVAPPPPLTRPGYPSLVDFTGDHRADLGEWHRPSGQFWVRATSLNAIQAPGQFWAHASTVTPTAGWEVLTADFNGDGFADYLDRHVPSGKIWIHLGNGAGGFSPNVWVTSATRTGVDVEVFPGDVNGDHFADLIEHDRATGELHVRLNTGIADPVPNADVINQNNFLLAPSHATFHTATGSDWRTVVGDFTGDGFVDVVDYHAPSAQLWVHANVGGGQWSASASPTAAFSNPAFTTLFGDFTGDGYADYADANLSTGDMWVHENLHNGTFSAANWAYTVLTHSSGFCVMGLPVCWP